MDNNTSKMDQILSKLRERYRHVDSLMSSTKEMEKAINLNDLVSLQMVLGMRQKAMDRIDALNSEISKIAESLEQPHKEKVNRIISSKPEDSVQPDGPLETSIFDTNKATLHLLKRVRDLDAEVTKRFQQEKRG